MWVNLLYRGLYLPLSTQRRSQEIARRFLRGPRRPLGRGWRSCPDRASSPTGSTPSSRQSGATGPPGGKLWKQWGFSYQLKGKFPQIMWIVWMKSNFRNPTVKVWANLDTVYANIFAYRYFREFGLNFCKFLVHKSLISWF